MDILSMQYCKCGCGKVMPKFSDGRKTEYWNGHKKGIVHRGVNDPIQTNCGYCQNEIIVERWRIEKFGICFCSRDHQKKYRSIRAIKELTCEFCGKKFFIQPSKKQGKHIFCSLSCSTKFNKPNPPNKIPIKCDQCGIEIMIHPSKHKINKHFFCSTNCRKLFIHGTNNPAYRSGYGRKREYAANWKSQRRAAITRDGNHCQSCGRTPKKSRYLHVHHIQPAYLFNGDWEKANNLINLITLCMTCHKKVETGKISIQPKLF